MTFLYMENFIRDVSFLTPDLFSISCTINGIINRPKNLLPPAIDLGSTVHQHMRNY